jgi:hypothetical protein
MVGCGNEYSPGAMEKGADVDISGAGGGAWSVGVDWLLCCHIESQRFNCAGSFGIEAMKSVLGLAFDGGP